MCGASRTPSGGKAPAAGRRSVNVDWLLIDIDRLVTGERKGTTIRNGAVAISGRRIEDLGPSAELENRYRARHRLSLRGFMVIPGLINTHCHAAMSVFRGLADDLPLTTWLQEVIFPAEGRFMNAELVYRATLLAAVEMVRAGITTCCDGYFFEEAAARAFHDVGMRAVVGQGILDFPTPDQPDPGRGRERVAAFEEAVAPFAPRVRPSLFCHAPYTCGPQTLQWVKAYCRERGWLFQIHLSETQGEVEDLSRRHGKRPVFYLDELGILDELTLCAHAVWTDQDEIARLAARGAAVSHNVQSNMKLASGIAPVPRLLQARVTVALGTDGCASNNSLDLFAEMDRAAKLHKAVGSDPTTCPAPAIFAMAGRCAANAIGWGAEIGSIAPGKRADLVAIDLDQPHLTPLYDSISHLVYVVRRSDVRHVWIDGHLVVENRCVAGVDVARAMQDLRRAAAAIASHGDRKLPASLA